MPMDWIIAAVGLVLLGIGGDVLVRGAMGLAARLSIPPLIISLTVVAFGTSAPELIVAIQSALEGVPEMALGNVVGSNTANVLLVLSVPALISGVTVTSDRVTNTNYIMMLGASVLFIVLAFLGPFEIWHGLVLLVALALILAQMYMQAMNSREARAALEKEVEDDHLPVWKISTYLIGGLIALPLGADWLVEGASNIAVKFGVSQGVIGLTLIAVGTSLPELATAISAALRRQCDVVLGNVLGSNVFNLLAIFGITSFFGPIAVPYGFLHHDLWVMLGASLLLAPFIFMGKNLRWVAGAIFLAIYIGYFVYLFA